MLLSEHGSGLAAKSHVRLCTHPAYVHNPRQKLSLSNLSHHVLHSSLAMIPREAKSNLSLTKLRLPYGNGTTLCSSI